MSFFSTRIIRVKQIPLSGLYVYAIRSLARSSASPRTLSFSSVFFFYYHPSAKWFLGLLGPGACSLCFRIRYPPVYLSGLARRVGSAAWSGTSSKGFNGWLRAQLREFSLNLPRSKYVGERSAASITFNYLALCNKTPSTNSQLFVTTDVKAMCIILGLNCTNN